MSGEKVLQPEALRGVTNNIARVLSELDKIILGKASLHKMLLAAVLARGHVLLEGVPGIGKTTLVKGLSDILSLSFKRAQFTPDLMPSDILGTHILQELESGRRGMVFEPGPVFTNILLADEINRATPKTQSALLEAMQEKTVSLLGETKTLPAPFFVIATQNPIELEGTYPLPEAQLDRFLFRLIVRDVDAATLKEIITTRRRGAPPQTGEKLPNAALEEMFAAMDGIYLSEPVAHYIADIVASSRPDAAEAPDEVKQYVAFGASPRGAIAIAESARALALIEGRPTVGFEDVDAVAKHALNHRIALNYKARFDKVTEVALIDKIIATVNAKALHAPATIEIGTSP